MGLLSLRNLGAVMMATVHVAVVSSVFRSFLSPTSPAGSVAVWVPLSILVSVFLSMPLGRAVAGAFGPPALPSIRACPRCRLGELRPLRRHGAGLYAPASGYRCAGCATTFRPVGETFIEEPAPHRNAPADPDGVRFLTDLSGTSASETLGIRFLDEPA